MSCILHQVSNPGWIIRCSRRLKVYIPLRLLLAITAYRTIFIVQKISIRYPVGCFANSPTSILSHRALRSRGLNRSHKPKSSGIVFDVVIRVELLDTSIHVEFVGLGDYIEFVGSSSDRTSRCFQIYKPTCNLPLCRHTAYLVGYFVSFINLDEHPFNSLFKLIKTIPRLLPSSLHLSLTCEHCMHIHLLDLTSSPWIYISTNFNWIHELARLGAQC